MPKFRPSSEEIYPGCAILSKAGKTSQTSVPASKTISTASRNTLLKINSSFLSVSELIVNKLLKNRLLILPECFY